MDSSANSDPVTLTSRDGAPCEVPDEFLCPITLSPMQRPMVTRTGLNFERSAILQWLQTSPSCPLTRTPLRLKDVIPNPGLEAKIQTWLESNDIPNINDEDEEVAGADEVTFFLIVPASAKPKKQERQRESQEATGSGIRRFHDRLSRGSARSRPRTLAARSG